MKKIICLLLFCIITIPSFAEKSKDEIFKSLKDKYNNISSIQLSFETVGNMEFKGEIKAKKGNKYIITMPMMTVISNGKTIWNYNERDDKVLISNFENNTKGAFSIDRIFFSLMSEYKPDKLNKISKSTGKSYYELTMEAIDKSKKAQFTKFKIRLAKNGQDITNIEYEENGNTQSVNVSNIILNPKLNDKIFNFKASKGTEVIDMR